ncbi:hypothetical protein PVAP13_9NG773400 [Panicum virgatum]|uniref:Large ribosomal subunit protein uL5 C-terminal domain-containing protein n=1 Tax=Panicum virgatum TaxID=38727 RepID=A0A8T0N4V8_PANVG|nr:hypothetical protein PVAP13_9NG773400 [Panicum virgatum]
MAATAVTVPSSGVPFPVSNTAARRCLLLPSPLPRRALRVVASAATEAPPKPTPPPISPSGIVLVDPAEAQRVHRLKAVYDQKVVPLITEEFGYTNVHQIMYNFLDRIINLGLPRTMDFLGVNPNSFDGHGNYSLGLRDQGVFPEIPYEVGGKKNGMDVCIVTTAKTDNEAFRLLALLGMPFSENIKSDVVIRKKRLKRHHFLSKGKGKGGRK